MGRANVGAPWTELSGYFAASTKPVGLTIGSTPNCVPRSGSTFCSRWWNDTDVHLAKLQTDLREFIELLSSHNVEYIVVGGHAVAYHGHPRVTGGIDFLVRPTPTNADRVLTVLNAFGFRALGIAKDDVLQPGQIVQLGQPPNRIDLLTSISGVAFDEAWQSRISTDLDDVPIHMLGWDALWQNKRTSKRHRDRRSCEASCCGRAKIAG